MAWQQWASLLAQRTLRACIPHHARAYSVKPVPAPFPLRMILTGAPGSGKGTQAAFIRARYGLHAVTAGQLLRDEVGKGGPQSQIIKDKMHAGDLVPEHVTQALMAAELSRLGRKDGWLVDGFPRSKRQAEMFDAWLLEGQQPLSIVLNLRASEAELLDRLAGRMVHPASGRTYHPSSSPPRVPGRDDVTGEPLIIRDDDHPDTVLHRLRVYEEETRPVLQHYSAAPGGGTIVAHVAVDGEYPHTVWPQVQGVLDACVACSRAEGITWQEAALTPERYAAFRERLRAQLLADGVFL